MKNLLILLLVFFAVGCAKQGKNKDLVVVSEKPFIARPTNKAIYEDCKRAIELYENKDPNYATTMCIAEIRGTISSSYFYGAYQQIKNPEAFEICQQKLFLDGYDKKQVKEDFDKYPISVFLASQIVKLHEKYKDLENISSNDYFVVMAIYYDKLKECKEIKDLSPLKNTKDIETLN